MWLRNYNFTFSEDGGGALILFLVSGKIRVTSSPTTSLFIGTEVMKDSSDFNYQLELPETRKSFLCDSSMLSKSAHWGSGILFFVGITRKCNIGCPLVYAVDLTGSAGGKKHINGILAGFFC